MIGLLYRWLIGSFHTCQHEYEIIDTCEDPYGYKIYTSQCKKCGNLKSYKSTGH